MRERVFFEEFESLYFFHGTTPNWTMQGFHFHNQYEIILFLGESATLEVGNRIYSAECGDLFLLNNKEYHRTNGVSGKEYNRYVLMFEPEVLNEMLGPFGYDFAMYFENRPSNFIHKLHLSGTNLEKIEQQLHKIELNINSASSKVLLKLAILELVANVNEMYEFFMRQNEAVQGIGEPGVREIGKQVDFKDPVMYRERIEQIKKFISDHVEVKLELDDIAREFYISRYYLSHYFKKETGFTVVQYITNKKILAAKELLKKGYTVTEVATRLSYNSDSHFISVFKKSSGITPKQYAKEKKSNNT